MKLFSSLVQQSVRCFSTEVVRKPSLLKHIKNRIETVGPITVADYMKEVLTHQGSGYYMVNDVFGKKGDFITSPEISQLFGEMISVWCLAELKKLGFPKPLQLIELGPGRGTMMEDILRVFTRFNVTESLSVHLIEISPELSALQAKRLCVTSQDCHDQMYYKTGITSSGVKIFWYKGLQDVSKGHDFCCIIANEFFDALPIHKFQKTKDGWREVLVDIDPLDRNSKLRFVLAPCLTASNTLFKKQFNEDELKRDHVEFSPLTGVIIEHLASRLESHGGIALIVDYGHTGEKTDTFRGFRNHKLHDPLEDPGTADLTADVDFSLIQKLVSDKLITYGPVTQQTFLKSLHIEQRYEILSKRCSDEATKASLKSGFDMLMSPNQMGERFKVMSMYPAVLKDFLMNDPPVGFQTSE